MYDIITIAGSPFNPSRCDAILEYARDQLEEAGLRTAGIRVCDLPAADLLAARSDSPAIREVIDLLAPASGVIIATPIYKAAYSGVLKTLLDLLPQQALAGKLVLPIATGGSLAHLLAIDYALRPVLASLGAQQILPGVFAQDADLQLIDGTMYLDAALRLRLDGALQAMSNLKAWEVFAQPHG